MIDIPERSRARQKPYGNNTRSASPVLHGSARANSPDFQEKYWTIWIVVIGEILHGLLPYSLRH
jgi:hypothetical protein